MVKKIQTEAEKAGITSVKAKEKEIKKVTESSEPVPPVVVKPPKKKRILSEEQKNILRERLVKAREIKQQKKINQT